jgi:hypothetical protein
MLRIDSNRRFELVHWCHGFGVCKVPGGTLLWLPIITNNIITIISTIYFSEVQFAPESV